MEIEFHYWITGLIAKRAGFADAEARTIAHASQFVDDNDISFKIRDRQGGDVVYQNFISQTMNILKPKRNLMRVYSIFHFVPGNPMAQSANRNDGKMHLLNTTPNNEHANTFINAALNLDASDPSRLYRIGIASHCYVDTWAHQNFVGWYDYFNNIGLDPKPDIGHADGEHHPDWVGHQWEDSRLVAGEINNNTRFLSAAKALFFKYCDVTRPEDPNAIWGRLQEELIGLFGTPYTGGRIKYRDERMEGYMQATGWRDEFDETAWFKAAIDTNVRGLRDSHDGIGSTFTVFEDEYHWKPGQDHTTTNWYNFQQAVKAHEKLGIATLKPIFARIGQDIARA